MDQKLNTILKRVQDLREVEGNTEEGMILAFQELKEVLHQNKPRHWTELFESIMRKFIEIGVELKKGNDVKAGLALFRNITQGSNTNSLDNVLELYMDLSEMKIREQFVRYNKIKEQYAPEHPLHTALLLKVSGANEEERLFRQIVLPWVKFAFEAYKNVMDLLKQSRHLEKRYHNAIHRGFALARKYNRKMDFKRICENIRSHFGNLEKYSNVPVREKESSYKLVMNPDTMKKAQETKFRQISTAIYLDLWQDAYRSSEELFQILKKVNPPPNVYRTYYEQLVQIFWKSKNYSLHAYAWIKLFSMATRISEKRERSNQVLLSTLLTQAESLRIDERATKMGELMDLTSVPSFDQLMGIAESEGIAAYADPQVLKLFNLFRSDISPILVCQSMKKTFDAMDDSFKDFFEPLKEVLAPVFIEHLGQIYDSISLKDAIDFSHSLFTSYELEKEVIQAAVSHQIPVRLDQRDGTIEFGVGIDMFQANSVKNVLINFAQDLHDCHEKIQPKQDESSFISTILLELEGIEEKKKLRDALSAKIQYLENSLENERDEKLEKEKAAYKSRKIQEEAKRAQLEEEKRVAERERLKKEEEEQQKVKMLYSALLKEGTAPVKTKKQKVTKDLVDKLIMEKTTKMEQERKAREKRRAEITEQLDFTERAMREAQVKKIDGYYKYQASQDKQLHESRQNQLVKSKKRQLKKKLAYHDQFKKMFAAADSYLESMIKPSREKDLKKALKAYNVEVEERKAKWTERRAKIAAIIEEEEEKLREKERMRQEEIARLDQERRSKLEIIAFNAKKFFDSKAKNMKQSGIVFVSNEKKRLDHLTQLINQRLAPFHQRPTDLTATLIKAPRILEKLTLEEPPYLWKKEQLKEKLQFLSEIDLSKPGILTDEVIQDLYSLGTLIQESEYFTEDVQLRFDRSHFFKFFVMSTEKIASASPTDPMSLLSSELAQELKNYHYSVLSNHAFEADLLKKSQELFVDPVMIEYAKSISSNYKYMIVGIRPTSLNNLVFLGKDKPSITVMYQQYDSTEVDDDGKAITGFPNATDCAYFFSVFSEDEQEQIDEACKSIEIQNVELYTFDFPEEYATNVLKLHPSVPQVYRPSIPKTNAWETPSSGSRFGNAPPSGGRYGNAPPSGGRYGNAPPPGGRYPPSGDRYGNAPPPGGRYGKYSKPSSNQDDDGWSKVGK